MKEMSLRQFIKNNASFRRLYNSIQIHIHGKKGIQLTCKGLGKNVRINNHGNNNAISIGCGVKLINCRFNILGNNVKISIGDNCFLRDVEFWVENDNGYIDIHNNTRLTGQTQLASIEGSSITIGEACLFSSNIHIRTGDSHSILDMNQIRINPSQNVYIGNHVWIGQSVIILKGVCLPDNSIVGAGAVVTKQFTENNVVVAGNPARCVKRNINWTYER